MEARRRPTHNRLEQYQKELQAEMKPKHRAFLVFPGPPTTQPPMRPVKSHGLPVTSALACPRLSPNHRVTTLTESWFSPTGGSKD
jgi:hypothetical protein